MKCFKNSTKHGFTIIELMLAMAFMSVLMITIAFLVIRIMGIYQKGLTIRSINQVGRNVISELSRAVAESQRREFSQESDYFASVQKDNTRPLSRDNPQLYGAFCTGTRAYLWNTGTAINDGSVKKLTYGSGRRAFRLLRIESAGSSLCQNFEAYVATGENIPDDATLAPVDILALSSVDTTRSGNTIDTTGASEADLALYDFRVFIPTVNTLTGHALYSATFTLATLRGVDITAQGDYCQNPSLTLNTDFSYCAINKFNFAMSTTGNAEGEEDDYGNIRY
jgi:prepilin-type N-terminal cleavage/methylation domain-containing protein